jgi:hypothetical protein
MFTQTKDWVYIVQYNKKMNSRDESNDGQTLVLYKAQPTAVQTLIKHQFFALMLRYKLLSSFALVFVENFDGINEFIEFNSVDGPQPTGFELLFQKTVGHYTETIAHPWYNGILEADTFMNDRFPEIWNLVLLEMVQDKHDLFNDSVQSVDTFNQSSPNPFADISIWLDVLETIVGAHIQSVAGVLFERNEVTKQKSGKWMVLIMNSWKIYFLTTGPPIFGIIFSSKNGCTTIQKTMI